MILYISLLSKASGEIPPFPPLKKGGGGGIYGQRFHRESRNILNPFSARFYENVRSDQDRG